MSKQYSHQYFDEEQKKYIDIDFVSSEEDYLLTLRESFRKNSFNDNKIIENQIKHNFSINNVVDNYSYIVKKKNNNKSKSHKFLISKLSTTYTYKNISYFAWNHSLIVMFNNSYNQTQMENIINETGYNILDNIGSIFLIQYYNDTQLEEAREEYNKIPGVLSEINMSKITSDTSLRINMLPYTPDEIFTTQDNPLFCDTQKIHETGLKGNSNVRIGVLDDGVYNHKFLKKAISNTGYDYVEKSKNQKFNPEDWHGTMCAGIIGAQKNNEFGMNGIAAGCTIVPLKIIQGSISCVFFFIKALYEAAHKPERQVDIISCSLDTKFPPSEIARIIINEITSKTSNRKAIPLVFSAGNIDRNEPKELDFIRKLKSVISVAAVDEEFKPLSNSKYGKQIFISSIGSKVITLDKPGDETYIWKPILDHNDFLYFSQTSAAAPQVAAVIGLIMSKEENITIKEIKEILINCTCPKFEGINQDKYGVGVLNIKSIINYLNQ